MRNLNSHLFIISPITVGTIILTHHQHYGSGVAAQEVLRPLRQRQLTILEELQDEERENGMDTLLPTIIDFWTTDSPSTSTSTAPSHAPTFTPTTVVRESTPTSTSPSPENLSSITPTSPTTTTTSPPPTTSGAAAHRPTTTNNIYALASWKLNDATYSTILLLAFFLL